MLSDTLAILPSARAVPENGKLFLDRKMVDGLRRYADTWPGPVHCLMRHGPRKAIAFGQLYDPAGLPFAVSLIDEDPARDHALLDDAALILAAGDNHLDLGLAGSAKAPLVYIIENTISTRLRVLALDGGPTWRRLKATIWTLLTERRRHQAFRASAGLQCNGMPAFDAYRSLTPAPLLFFDTRTRETQMIAAAELAAKQSAILEGQSLRLAFSGRLERIKGADHLVQVARALKDQNVAFTMTIYGEGSLRPSMEQEAIDQGVASAITFAGAVPFETVLMPALAQDTDLFVCCHRQADPSCTYLETYGAGVPIVGYDNAAFMGVLALGDAGVATEMDDPAALATAIAALDTNRPRLATMAAKAAQIGAAHSFEKVFAQRVDHLKQIAGLPATS